MTLKEIEGHARSVDLLRGMLRSGRLPHALVFQGPVGVGKATTARALAAVLLCVESGLEPCGSCDSCRMAAGEGHPDLSRVVLEVKPTSPSGRAGLNALTDEVPSEDLRKVITVDQIREVSRLAGLAPRIGSRRAFLIDPADQMNSEAQNSLLKTLEEPPGNSVLILIASRTHLLLPTVRSRCFAVRFGPMRTVELAAFLESRGVRRDDAMARAALAEGRIGRALELDLDLLRERREEILDAVEALAEASGNLERLSTMVASLAGSTEETLVEGLDLLESLLRDAARAGVGLHGDALVHADLGPRLEALGRRLGSLRAASLVRAAERLRGELRFNLNRTLIAESLLAAVAGGPLP